VKPTPARSVALSALVMVLSVTSAPLAAQASADTTLTVRFGVFVDAYYAYDSGRPVTFDRSFTTQPARANEFNVNLAHIEASLAGDQLRGRLALQAGTSVHSNYTGEPTNGSVSGPALARHLQEAYVGYQVSPALWVDAGIFFSNAGAEGWVSADNLTYTRSLVADFSPYYSTGVRATWQATPRLTARLDVINGWQNISETNDDKAVGTRLDFTVRDGVTLSHYAYAGNEVGGRFRLFTGASVVAAVSGRVRLLAQVDVGQQERVAGGATDAWTGGVAAARWQLSRRTALVARGEWYNDPAEVIITTGAGVPSFRARGGSLGLDVSPRAGFAWRTEARLLSTAAAVFPDRGEASGLSRSNLVLVSALTLRH